MALADIVQRIDREAVAEAFELVSEAQKRADTLVEQARQAAEEERQRTLAKEERQAHAEADTLLATARLEARDRMLASKRELVEDVLKQAREIMLAMADDVYADMLAKRVVAAARGGETVLLGSADVERLASRLPSAVVRAGGGALGLVWGSVLAPVEYGVVLRGDRVSVELSVDSAIDERRDELAMRVADALFGESGA